MSGGALGRIYVELDLDKDRFMKNQRILLEEAQKGAKNLEKNFKNLGIKSDATYDLMRAQAIQSFKKIESSHNTTVDDMIRAEKAKANRIIQINEQQYGKQISMMHNLKSSYLAISASIAASLYVMQTVTQPFVAAFEKGFNAVEDYAQSVAGLAAMVVTFTERAKGVSLSEQWEKALKYSTAMVPILENLAAKTLLSGQETTALANAFARSGVFLNASNEKQVESFTRISNALPLMTKGQEIMSQINSEVRAVMTGANAATSMMLQTLRAIDPELDKNLQTWRAEGTVLEHIGDLLVGFGPATQLLENQWQAVKSTIETTATQILRGLMKPAYESVIDATIALNEWLLKNKETIINWGTSFRIVLIDIEAEILRLAMLLDKMGGTWTTMKMGLYGPGSALGVESSEKRFEAAAAANMEYAARYEESSKRLEQLAKDQIALENELADTTSNAAQKKADASATFTAKVVVDLKANAKALKTLEKEMAQATKDAEHLEKAFESLRKKLLQIENEKAWHVQDMSDWVRAGAEAIDDMERDFGVYMDNLNRDIENTAEKTVQENKSASKETSDLWMHAMNRVESGIADAFYGVFTRQFDSIEDGFQAMLDAMLRMLAEYAAAATMFDIFGVGSGSASWSGAVNSIFGGSGGAVGGGKSGGLLDWVTSIGSMAKSGYEIYTGESLMGQVYNFAAESLASIFATETSLIAGQSLMDTGMFAGISSSELEAMIVAELAASEGIGTGTGVVGGAGISSGAAAGIAAAAVAAIMGITMIWANQFRPDAQMTVAFKAGVSDLYDRLFDFDFLKVITNQGFDPANAETELYSLFGVVADTFNSYEQIWSLLGEESKAELKSALGEMGWDNFVLEIRAWAKDGGPLDVRAIFDKDQRENPNITAIDYPGQNGKIIGPAGNTQAIMWDILAEYFQPYISEAIGNLMDEDVFQLMADDIQAAVAKLQDIYGWTDGMEKWFESFDENIEKIQAAAIAYDGFNNLIEGTTKEYTNLNRAAELAQATAAQYIATLNSMGVEVDEEAAKDVASRYAQGWAALSGDLSAVSEKATAADLALAGLVGRFDVYWEQMIEAGIDVEKLGDKTELLTQAQKKLLDQLQSEVWDQINQSVADMMTETGQVEGQLSTVISSFYEMYQALIQVNAATEDLVLLETQALDVMKYKMGLAPGTNRAGQIEERYSKFGLSAQQMIDAFAKMDLDGLKEIAASLGINWWDIANDIAWLVDNMDEAGNVASETASEFAAMAQTIRDNIQAIQDQIDFNLYKSGGGSESGYYMGKIEASQSAASGFVAAGDLEAAMTSLITASSYLNSWYSAAVAEATAAAQEVADAERERLTGLRDALNEQLRVAQAFGSLIDTIKSTIISIESGSLNVALPTEKATMAENKYDALKAAALASGSVEDYQAFVSYAQTALQLNQDANKSSQAYQDYYAMVMADLLDAQANAEAKSYDEAILATLEQIDEDISNIEVTADLTDVNDTFARFAGEIGGMIGQINTLNLILNIDWGNWDGDMADALEMLLALVDVYGWDHEYTLKFLTEVPLDIFSSIDDLAKAAGWIADETGGWNSKATIAFLKNVAANWEFQDIDEILTSIGWVAKQAGSYGADATVAFVTTLMDRYGVPLADMPAWYAKMGLTDAELFNISVEVAAKIASFNMYDASGNLKTVEQMIKWIMAEIAPYYPAEVTKAVGIKVLGDILTLSMPSNLDTAAEIYAWLTNQLKGLVPPDIQDTITANILTTSLTNSMPSNLDTSTEISTWLTTSLRGIVPDSVADQVIANITMNLIGAGTLGMDSIAEINAYIDSLGIINSDISRTLKINIIYDMVSSGGLSLADVAEYAYNQAFAAWTAKSYDPAAISILKNLEGLSGMWNVHNPWALSSAVNLYGGYNTTGQSWADLWDKHGLFTKSWAEGGIVNSPTYGLVGEAGYPEAIIPMKDGMNIPVKWINGGSTQADANKGEDVELLREQNRLLHQIAAQGGSDLRIKGMNKYARAVSEDVIVERVIRKKTNSPNRYVS